MAGRLSRVWNRRWENPFMGMEIDVAENWESSKRLQKCKPVVDELQSAESWGVNQIYDGHVGWTAILAALEQNKRKCVWFAYISTVILLGITSTPTFVPPIIILKFETIIIIFEKTCENLCCLRLMFFLLYNTHLHISTIKTSNTWLEKEIIFSPYSFFFY